jgi:hypothetical protein
MTCARALPFGVECERLAGVLFRDLAPAGGNELLVVGIRVDKGLQRVLSL